MISIKKNNYFAEIIFSHDPCDLRSKDEEYEVYRDFLKESALRAKKQVLDYGYNNYWTHFITLTIDSKKIDATDKNLILKKVLKQFDNYKQRYDKTFKYILIPELGSVNKRLHFHGIIYTKCDKFLNKLFFDTLHQVTVYRNEWFYKNIGANQFTAINNNSEAIARYICKYMGKNLDRDFYKIYNCWYFCSKGLQKSDILFEANVDEYFQFKMYRDFIHGRHADFENSFIEKWIINDPKEIARLEHAINEYELSKILK